MAGGVRAQDPPVKPLPESATTLPPLDQRAWTDPGAAFQPQQPTQFPVGPDGAYLSPQQIAQQQAAQNPFAAGPNAFWNGLGASPLGAFPQQQAALDILRDRGTRDPKAYQNRPDLWVGKTGPTRANAQEFEAEYWEKAIKDPEKRLWLARRAIMLGFAKYDPTSEWMVSEDAFTRGGVYQMWKQAGEIVTLNPTLNQMTPEEYLDSMYGRLGGDTGLSTALDAAKRAEPNPIQTTTQVSKYSMSTEQAASVADQVATAVLGRMASKDEMAKARRAMNRLMAANPTVSTTTTDSTDPDNVKVSTNTKAGVGPSDAAAAYEAKMKRSSEGMAFNVGKLMETAMSQMDRGL